MPFTAIYGLPGCGKSLFMLQYGLKIAEKYQLRIVSNFFLNQYAIAYYCKVNGYEWLLTNIGKDLIYYVSANKNFSQLLQIKNAVILIDEFGLYAPSSQAWTLPPEAYNAIANNRKNRQHIIYAAQYPSQIHPSVNEILSDVIYCEGKTRWSQKMRDWELIFKDAHHFGSPGNFQTWYKNPKLRRNPVKVMVLAQKHWKGPINCNDALTFRCYESFELLEEQDEKVKFDNQKDFEYHPVIIDNYKQEDVDLSKLEARGMTLKQLDELASSLAEANRKQKKKVYEASKIPPFLAWKLKGKCPIKPHPWSQKMKHLWHWMPATSYRGIKKLDLKIEKNFKNYYKLSKEERKLFNDTIKWIRRGFYLMFGLTIWSAIG